jgi:hypothetical protein
MSEETRQSKYHSTDFPDSKLGFDLHMSLEKVSQDANLKVAPQRSHAWLRLHAFTQKLREVVLILPKLHCVSCRFQNVFTWF